MKQLNNILKKILDINVYKICFLIGCFLYTFPMTSIFMSEIFKWFLIWPLVIIGYDFFKTKKLGLCKESYILLVMILVAFLGCLWNYTNNLTSNIIIVFYMFVQIICMLIYKKEETLDSIIKNINISSKIILIITFICSILSILIYLFNIKLSIYNGFQEVLIGVFEGRLWSIYGNPNTLGHFSLISIWISLILLFAKQYSKKIISKRFKIFIWINIILQWLCILLSNSRSTMIAALVTLIIFFVMFIANKSKNKDENVFNYLIHNKAKVTGLLFVFIGLVILFSIVLKYIVPLTSVSIKVLNTETNSQIIETEKPTNETILKDEISKVEREKVTTDISNGRFDIWLAGLNVTKENILFGVGFKNVNSEINNYLSDEQVAEFPKLSENTHNIYLQILVAHGVIVFILFIIYLIKSLIKFIKFLLKYKGDNQPLYNILLLYFSLIISLLIINLFDSNILYFFSTFLVPIFWMSISFSENLVKIKDSNKKNVLILIDSLAEGGAEKVLVDMTNNLNYENYNVEVKTVYNEGSYREQLNENIVYSTIIKKPNIWKKRIINRLIKYLPSRIIYDLFITENYDIEIAFLEFLSTKILTGSNSSALKISWIHTDIFEHEGGTSLFYSKKQLIRSYQNFDKIVCVSKVTRDKFCLETKLYQDTITIYNPVDKDNIIKKANVECEIKKDKKKFTLVTIGRLNIHKGYLRLCKIINNLIKSYQDIELWIIGEGEERKALEKYIKENRLQDNIKLLGFQSNPYSYLKQADLFVSSSLVEGYSLVIAEAITLGIPVISTNTAGPLDILANGKYGLIVENTEEALYEGLKKLLDDKKLLKDLKIKSKERQAFFDIDKTISEIENIFDIKEKINKNSNLFCTVFTPAYNRAYSLERLYNSLKNQTYKDFEWIVVDDGSVDNTESLFKKWLKQKNDFKITYIKVENGGKQRAFNKGLDMARGKMFFCVDSDDYLDENALKKVYDYEQTISDLDGFAGVSGYKGYSQEEPVGNKISKEYIDCSNNERNLNNLLGDKAEVYYTDLLKRYKFPEVVGEKFVSESVVWNKIGYNNYKIRWFNDIIYYCDYLDDGLTKQGMKLYKNNPKGYLMFIRNSINYTNTSILERLQHYYGYYDAVKDKLTFEDIAVDLQISKITLKITIFIKKIKDVIKGENNA